MRAAAAAAAATRPANAQAQPVRMEVQSMMHTPQPSRVQLGGPRLKSRPVETVKEQPKVAMQTRTAEYTPEQFDKTWDNYIATHQADHLLINTMRACRPVPGEGNSYTMTVESDIQAGLVNERLADILVYLRSTLSNTMIDITVVTNEGAASPATWNEREVISDIASRHPSFVTFAKALDLKLS